MRFRKRKPRESPTHCTTLNRDIFHRPTRGNPNAAFEFCLLVGQLGYEASDACPPLKSFMGFAKKIAEWPNNLSNLKESIYVLEHKTTEFLKFLDFIEPHITEISNIPPSILLNMENVRSEMRYIQSEVAKLRPKSERRVLSAIAYQSRRLLHLRTDSTYLDQLRELFIRSAENYDRTFAAFIVFHMKESKDSVSNLSSKVQALHDSLKYSPNANIIPSQYAIFCLFYYNRPLATCLITSDS